jgi:hypothetical protein
MRHAIAAILLVSVTPGCNWIVGDPHYCPPGQVENQALQACVTPPACDAGVVNERNECVETSGAGAGGSVGRQTSSQRRAVAGRSGAGQAAGRSGGGAAGGNGGSGGQRAVAPQDAGMSTTGGTGGASAMADAGMSEAAGTGMPMSMMPSGAPSEPKCGNGVREGAELCDGPDCPTECKSADPSNPCVGAKVEGSAATCDVHCVPTLITACTAGDKCCPMGCNHGTDADCSPSCGDGVLTGSETCEPASKEHPCPALADCDDGDVCTMDSVTGSAILCSAQCAHARMSRPFLDCADTDPCTDDTIVESTTACAYQCPHTRSEPTAAPNNCVDDDPCTDDTPVLSKTSCAYTCPHALVREGTDCGGGRMCKADGRCENPPARCGDGRVSPPEECDPQVPGWAGACGTDCRRTLYTECPCSGGAECISGMCTFSCHSATDCSRLPDRPVPACIPIYRNDISKCVLSCTGDADCPSGLVCRTFLDVVKGQTPASWQYCASADAP